MNRKHAPGILSFLVSALFATWVLMLSGSSSVGKAETGHLGRVAPETPARLHPLPQEDPPQASSVLADTAAPASPRDAGVETRVAQRGEGNGWLLHPPTSQ